MKGLSRIVLVSLLALSGCAESASKVFPLPDHAGKSGLKGEVESLLEEEFLVHPMTGVWEDVPYSVLRFDYGEQGQLVHRHEKSGSSVANSDTLMYGENGLLMERRKVERGMGLKEKRLFLYDEEGRMVEFQVFNEAGKLSRKERSSFNEQGKVAERFVLQQAERTAQAPLEIRNRELYDYSEAGIVKGHKRYSGEVLVLEEAFVNGNLVSERRYDAGSGTLLAVREVEWSRPDNRGTGVEKDGAGHVVKRDTVLLDEGGREVYFVEADSAGNILLRIEREYDAFGSLTLEIYAVRGQSAPEAMATMFRDTVRYDFVYDKQGNWTQSDRMRNGEPDVRIRRSIAYRLP